MKLKANRADFADAASFVARVVKPNPSRPIYSTVRVEVKGDRAHLCATNGDRTLETVVAVSDAADGIMCIPAKLLADVARRFDGADIVLDGVDEDGKTAKECKLSSGRAEFTLRCASPEEFPKAASVPEHSVTLDAESFSAALGQVVPAASADPGREALCGVLLAAHDDGLRLVATDSYRLVMRDLPGASVLEDGQQVLVPAAALADVVRLASTGDLVLHLADSEAVFEAGANRLRTRLIAASYPEYQRLLPTNAAPTTVKVAREELAAAVRRVGLMVTGTASVKFSITEDGVSVTATTVEVGDASEDVDATLTGEPIDVSFNHEYVVAALSAATSDTVTIEVRDAVKPAIIRDGDREDTVFLVMPMRSN